MLPTKLIQPRLAQWSDCVALAESEDLSFELIEFADQKMLDTGFDDLLDRYDAAMEGCNIDVVSVHGPFMDICLNAPDPAIERLSRHRIEQSLVVAQHFKARYAIYHANWLPSVATYEGYTDFWVKANVKHWTELTDAYPNITFLLENMFDDQPTYIARVVETVNAPNLRVLLNIGHCNAFSAASVSAWFGRLSDYIDYLHLSDNDGTSDESLPPGQGTVDWAALTTAVTAQGRQPSAMFGIAERGLSAVKESINYLRERSFYPYAEEAERCG